MMQYDRMVGTGLAVGNPVVGAVIKNNAVDEAFDDRRTFVLLRLNHAIDSGRHIDIQRAGKERASCAENEFTRDKRALHRTERR